MHRPLLLLLAATAGLEAAPDLILHHGRVLTLDPQSRVAEAVAIEAGRITITRHMKRKGKLWIRTFPWKSVTKKPTEVRMGKGKGDPEFWVDVIRPGKILFELEGIDAAEAREAMRLAAQKLPVKTRFISRAARELR